MAVVTGEGFKRSGLGSRGSSFFKEVRDFPRYEQHGFVSRHVSKKALEAAWQLRVRYHNGCGHPRHSRRILEWNGLYVLYELHLPPPASLPPEVNINGKSSCPAMDIGTRQSEGTTTSACAPGAVFRSNAGLVSLNGRYTFIQHEDNELAIYDTEGGVIWNPDGKVPADVGASGGDNTVYTEFQQSGDLVQYADRGGWHGRVALWRSRLGGGGGGDRLVMQNDGNLVIYRTKKTKLDDRGRPLPPQVAWESDTSEKGGVNRVQG